MRRRDKEKGVSGTEIAPLPNTIDERTGVVRKWNHAHPRIELLNSLLSKLDAMNRFPFELDLYTSSLSRPTQS